MLTHTHISGLNVHLNDIGFDHDVPECFLTVLQRAEEKIAAYAPDMLFQPGHDTFYNRLTSHQKRVALDAAHFMKTIDYPQKTVHAIYSSLLIHDIGKIHPDYNDPYIWNRPTKAEAHAEKPEKQKHTLRGVDFFNQLIKETCPELSDHPHMDITRAIIMLHHERINGQGYPYQIADLPEWLQIVGIVDTYDGDAILRGGQTPRTPEQILFRMSGQAEDAPKFIEAFNEDLLEAYTSYKLEHS